MPRSNDVYIYMDQYESLVTSQIQDSKRKFKGNKNNEKNEIDGISVLLAIFLR